MKKLVIVAAAVPLILGVAPAAMSAPSTPGAAVVYVSGHGGAYAGLPGPTDMYLAGTSFGTAVGRSGASGTSTQGNCNFAIDENLASVGTLTGGCEGGPSVSDCTMTWARTGLVGHAYGRCTVMGTRAAMVLEVALQPSSTRPMTTFYWYGTFAPAGESAV
jgi:hypothetical protein